MLLNEGQTPELLGRPAMYRGEPPGVAFTDSLIRFNAGERVDPEFALLVFRRHMRAGRFKRESRITTNIAPICPPPASSRSIFRYLPWTSKGR